MAKLLKFTGTVSTNKVGSECVFGFALYEDDLPADAEKRRAYIENAAQDAMYESGQFDWTFEQTGEEETEAP